MGGDGRSGASARSRPRSPPASRSSPPTRRCSPGTASRSRRSPRSTTSRSISRPRSRGGIPIVKTLREGLAGNTRRAHLRHPQRHLQLHPDPHGAGEAVLRRLPADAQRLGYAEADPTFDIEGHDTAQKLVDPREPRLRHQGRSGARSMSRASPRSRRPISKRPTSSAIASSCSASRCDTDKGIEQRVHPTMVPQGFGDRPGDGRDQCGDGRCRRHRADHAGRPRRRRHGDRLRGGRRHRRHRARRAHARRSAAPAVELSRQPQGADAAPRGRLLHPPAGASTSPGTAATIAQAPRRAEHLAGIDRAAPSRAAARRRRSGQAGRPGSGHPDHLRDHRGCGAPGACRGASATG